MWQFACCKNVKRFHAMVCINLFKEHKLALTRIERELEGTGAQMSKMTKYIRACSLSNRHLTASLNTILNNQKGSTGCWHF